jgi:hypothetical protein
MNNSTQPHIGVHVDEDGTVSMTLGDLGDLFSPHVIWRENIRGVVQTFTLFETGEDPMQLVRMDGAWTEEQWKRAYELIMYVRRLRACIVTSGQSVGTELNELQRDVAREMYVNEVEGLVRDFGLGVLPGDIREFWRASELHLGMEPTLAADQLTNPNEAADMAGISRLSTQGA